MRGRCCNVFVMFEIFTWRMMYLTQENAVDLPSVGHGTLMTAVWGKCVVCTACQKYEFLSLYDVVFFNRLEVKFVHRSTHTEHYRKQLHYRTGTKYDCTSVQIFLTGILPTSVTGH